MVGLLGTICNCWIDSALLNGYLSGTLHGDSSEPSQQQFDQHQQPLIQGDKYGWTLLILQGLQTPTTSATRSLTRIKTQPPELSMKFNKWALNLYSLGYQPDRAERTQPSPNNAGLFHAGVHLSSISLPFIPGHLVWRHDSKHFWRLKQPWGELMPT